MDIDYFRPRLRCLLLRTLIETAPPSLPAIRCPAFTTVLFLPTSTRDHLPTRDSPVSVLAYVENPITLPSLTRHHHSLTLYLLPRPHHAFQIPFAATPMLLPKYLLARSSAAVPQASDATTARAISPLPHIPSTSNISQILAVGTPTPLPSPASC